LSSKEQYPDRNRPVYHGRQPVARRAVKEIDINSIHRKLGIIDPATGNIIFVSRKEGYESLRKAAERPAVQIPVETVEKEIEVKKRPCACSRG
jgi:hypothetical protein